MKKQMQCILSVLFMIGFGLTGYGQNFGVEDYYYEITSSTSPPPQVRVIGYDASLGTGVTIPTTANHNGTDYDVTAIRKFSFDNEQLTRVTFTDTPGTPGKITSIGDNAFKHNQLASVTIPNNVTSIGKQAFGNNPDLRLVELLGNSPPGIHQNTFWRRDQINLVVPKGKREDYLNKGCTGSRYITEVAQVDDEFTVDYITYRITDTDPNSRKVSVIDYNTAEGPTTVNIPPTIQYQEIDYAVTSIGDWAFARTLRTDKLTSVIIPNGVKSIGIEAFRQNLLSSVTIPNSVISIGNSAFKENELTEVTFESPANLTSIGASTFKSNDLTEITIPGGVITIGNSAFSANQLISVDLPGSVTHIDLWAFANGNNQKINTIFVQATTPPSIEENTFGDRSETTVVVPDGARENYENNAKWTDFNSITEGVALSIEDAPSEIKSLSPFDVTFQFAREVTGFTIDDIRLDHATLSDFTGGGSRYTVKVTPTTCDGIIEITVPGNVAAYAPSFPASATVAVNATPVEACPAQIGDVFTVSGIDYEITSVNPNEVKVTGYTGSAAEVEIPGTLDDKDETYTVAAIGANAFREKQLTGVTIPGGVTSIGASAFVGNTDLDLVTVEATHPPSLHENAFSDRSQVDLVVPAGTREAYLAANGWTGFKSITEEKVVTAIRNYEFKDFTLYPNPARDKVYIDLRLGQKIKQVNIYTMTGAYLYSENGSEINTGRLSEGMYLFEIVTKTGARSMRKVIIQQ